MYRENRHPDGLVKVVDGAVQFSPVVFVSGATRTIFVSGQVPKNADGKIVGVGDMRAQIQQVGENVTTALEAAGATLADVVCSRTYVKAPHLEEFFDNADLWRSYLYALPTSTTVEVHGLAHPDFLVEIDVQAMTPLSQ